MNRVNVWLCFVLLGVGFMAAWGVTAAAGDKTGAELYQFWCSTCHGDQGQGLTPEWRATWPKNKQNCWQSKCHAANHPPEGFILPKTVPALIGSTTLIKFNTAQDLYAYTRATMPFWAPSRLSAEEYRAITLFLVEANYTNRAEVMPTPLPDDLTAIPLHPQTQARASTFSQSTDPVSTLPTKTVSGNGDLWIYFLGGMIGVGIIMGFGLRYLKNLR
jgi:mono/diheme cytochrome c family protein